MDLDLLREIEQRLERARVARPGIPDGEMLFSIVGDEHAESIAEVNASGEPMIFACLRTATADAGCIVRGSTRRTCNRCKAEVWISPATLETHDKMANAEIVCLDCIGLMPEEGEDPE
jgi:hypothetical protein